MDPKMDPEMELLMLILGDPCQRKALQGHFKVHIDQYLYVDLQKTEKLKFTAWFDIQFQGKSLFDSCFVQFFGPFIWSKKIG